MEDVRKPAVASMFYPDDKINLKRMINNFISDVPGENQEYFHKSRVDSFLGMIVPHAGYAYSGQVAAYAYSLLRQKTYDTVIILGPSHFTSFDGFSLPYFHAFSTPLGDVPVDVEMVEKIMEKGKGTFDYLNSAHVKEHSLEVQIPFLQEVLEEEFKIVPILMGFQSFQNVEKGAEILYDVLRDCDRHYLLVISSDLSHYHNDKTAREIDRKFMDYIEVMDTARMVEDASIGAVEACGAGPIGVLLETAKKFDRNNIRVLAYKTSGDVSGDRSRVVGYMAAAVW